MMALKLLHTISTLSKMCMHVWLACPCVCMCVGTFVCAGLHMCVHMHVLAQSRVSYLIVPHIIY